MKSVPGDDEQAQVHAEYSQALIDRMLENQHTCQKIKPLFLMTWTKEFLFFLFFFMIE